MPLVPATLDLRSWPEAKKASYVTRDDKLIRLGNGFLEAQFDVSTQKLIALVDHRKGQTTTFQSVEELTVEIGDPGKPLDLEPKGVDISALNGSQVIATYHAEGWAFKVRYWIEPGHFYVRKQAEVLRAGAKPALISKLTLLNGTIADGAVEQKISLNYQRVKDFQADCLVSFVRAPGENRTGYFFVIEFPHFKTELRGNALVKSIAPYQLLTEDQTFTSEPLVIGMYCHDDGSVKPGIHSREQWLREYIGDVCQPYSEFPAMDWNGFRQGHIMPNTPWLDALLRTGRRLGINRLWLSTSTANETMWQFYLQDPEFWMPTVHKARMLGYRLHVFGRMSADLGSVEHVGYVLGNKELARQGIESYIWDYWGLPIKSGEDVKDPKVTNKLYSRYRDSLASIRTTREIYGKNSWLEGHIGFMTVGPYVVKEIDFLHPMDEWLLGTDLAIDRDMADDTMWKIIANYDKYYLPLHLYRATVGHYGPALNHFDYNNPTYVTDDDSWKKIPIVAWGGKAPFHDIMGWRYSVMAALGGAGFLSFAHIDPEMPESEINWFRHWMEWARQNEPWLRQGKPWTNREVSVVSRIIGNKGFVFVYNHTVAPQSLKLPLSLDISSNELLAVKEIYPQVRTLGGPVRGGFANKETVSVKLDPREVRILEINPQAEAPEVLGATVKSRSKAGNQVRYVVEGLAGQDFQVGTAKGTNFVARDFRLPGTAFDGALPPPQKLNERVTFNFSLPAAELKRTNRNRFVPDTLEVRLKHSKLPLGFMQVAAGQDPLKLETWRMFPHAFSNRIYLHLTLDRPFDLEKEGPVEVNVNGKIFNALPMLNWGGPVYPETLLLNFERDFPKRTFINHRLIYVDVTDALVPGKSNFVSLNYPSVTGGFLHNWPVVPVEMEIEVKGEQISTRTVPRLK